VKQNKQLLHLSNNHFQHSIFHSHLIYNPFHPQKQKIILEIKSCIINMKGCFHPFTIKHITYILRFCKREFFNLQKPNFKCASLELYMPSACKNNLLVSVQHRQKLAKCFQIHCPSMCKNNHLLQFYCLLATNNFLITF
jgi:hypothetical protein